MERREINFLREGGGYLSDVTGGICEGWKMFLKEELNHIQKQEVKSELKEGRNWLKED